MNLSIGALAAATGVPPNTLRTWERRYGFPPSERSAGGQRVYSDELVEHVRLLKRALDLGFRPSNIMDVPFRELHEMVARARPEAVTRLPAPVAQPPGGGVAVGVQHWLEAAAALDSDKLENALRSSLANAGGLEAFVVTHVAPFLTAVGDAWMSGELSPYQEHFASEHLREFLVGRWRPLSDANGGPAVVATTMPGEQHDLGLHLAATAASLAGWRVVFLGTETPVPDILAAVRAASARALLISVSSFSDPTAARWNLGLLTERLPPTVELIGGGRGFPADGPKAVRPAGFTELREWLEARAHAHAAAKAE